MNLKKLQKTIEKIGEHLSPDGDWMPALLLESEHEALAVFGFVGECLANDRTKDATAEVITRTIAELKPTTACFITTAWALEFDEGQAGVVQAEMMRTGKIRASQHPDRIEIVNAYCYGDKGKNEGEVLMFGYIQRSKDKGPRIKKWKVYGDDDDDDSTTAKGRFPEAIQEGFKLARGG